LEEDENFYNTMNKKRRSSFHKITGELSPSKNPEFNRQLTKKVEPTPLLPNLTQVSDSQPTETALEKLNSMAANLGLAQVATFSSSLPKKDGEEDSHETSGLKTEISD